MFTQVLCVVFLLYTKKLKKPYLFLDEQNGNICVDKSVMIISRLTAITYFISKGLKLYISAIISTNNYVNINLSKM